MVGKFTYPILNSKNNILKFDKTNNNFRSIYSMAFNDDDSFWIGDDEGLVLYDGVNWKRFDTLNIIRAQRDREIFEKYKDTNWVKANYKDYLLEDEVYYWRASSYASNLKWDRVHNLWFKTSEHW